MAVPPWVAFALCTFIWGTTWLAIKIGYEGLDPLWGACLRFLLAGIVMLPFLAWGGVGWPRGRRQLGVVVAVGLLLFGLDYGLIYWGEQYLPSGLTAVLFGTLPLFVALGAPLVVPAERASLRHILGAVIGLAGLILIFRDEIAVGGRMDAMVAIVVSAAAAASASLIVRRWGRDMSPAKLNAPAMLVGALALAAASLLAGETPNVPATTNAWWSLAYLSLFGSVVGFLLYWGLLRQWAATRVSLIIVLTPVVAVLAGLAIGERLSMWQWVGSATVLAGVAVSLYAPAPAAAAAAGTDHA